jgi:endoglucanase
MPSLPRVRVAAPFLVLVAVLLGAVAATVTHGSGSSIPLTPVADPQGYWHTDSTSILDANGHLVRIAGVTWYGMESSYWVPAGLDYQPYTAIMNRVKALGFNTIRLPYSNELVESNPLVTAGVRANPEFENQHALSVMDAIVAYAAKIGLKIILDDHLSRATRPHTVNYLEEPLWYTSEYPQSHWVADWRFLARRYLDDDTVIGFDLRNEPHTSGPGPWNLHAYLTQGATWGPYNGVENPMTDWRLAAERAGNAVLAINPHLLIFVEGLQLYPDAAKPSGTDSYWWGSILTPALKYPVVLRVPHQLVYSAHDWGPWKWNMAWLRSGTYSALQAVWQHYWLFLLQETSSPNAAPVWIGEFGTCTNKPGCVDKQRPGNQARWFHLFLRFMRSHPNVGWSFFALNGSNANDHAAHNGLLSPTWNAVANRRLVADLHSIQPH